MTDTALSEEQVEAFPRPRLRVAPRLLHGRGRRRHSSGPGSRLATTRTTGRPGRSPGAHARPPGDGHGAVQPKAWGAVCDLTRRPGTDRQPYTWRRLHRQPLGGRRPAWAPASPARTRVAQGRRLLSALPRLARTGSAHAGAVVGRPAPEAGARSWRRTRSVPWPGYLAEHPEGVLPEGFPYRDLIGAMLAVCGGDRGGGGCLPVAPVRAARAGAERAAPAAVHHQPAAHPGEPMRFDRDDPRDFSPVERAVLRALGTDRYAFHPTRPPRPEGRPGTGPAAPSG